MATVTKVSREIGTMKCDDCGKEITVNRLAYDVTCACGTRYNTVGQKLRTYCCSLDEQGIDCGHGEGF